VTLVLDLHARINMLTKLHCSLQPPSPDGRPAHRKIKIESVMMMCEILYPYIVGLLLNFCVTPATRKVSTRLCNTAADCFGAYQSSRQPYISSYWTLEILVMVTRKATFEIVGPKRSTDSVLESLRPRSSSYLFRK